MAEQLLADFSGGMDASTAVDKLPPNNALLLENCRTDETGNILSAGAYTKQNTAAYLSSATTSNVHSLYWNPSLGAVAGVGQDVFIGTALGSLTSGSASINTNTQKMSFASAPGKVYFDVNSVGYWTDETNLLTVDWPPPSAASAAKATGTGTISTFTATNFGFAINTGSVVQGVQNTATVVVIIGGTPQNNPQYSVGANMLIGGVASGTSVSEVFPASTGTHTVGVLLGNANTLWGNASLTPVQVNGTGFGFSYFVSLAGGRGFTATLHSLSTSVTTVYEQSSGFVAAAATGGTLSGGYTYKITFVATNGEESDESVASGTVAVNGSTTAAGTITGIPAGDGRTASRNIYRKGGSLTSYYLVGSVPDNTTTTFLDSGYTDIQALAAGVILAGDIPGDQPNTRLGNASVRYPVYHYDRVFWVNQSKQNEIVWSKPLNGFAYPAVNFLDVGDSKPISRLVSIFGELIIIKTDSIWRLTGTDEESFNLSQTPSSVGTDQPFAVVALPDKIIFANKYGLWAFNGYTSTPLTTKLDMWFRQDDRTSKSVFGVNGFHPPEVSNSSVTQNFEAVADPEKFYLSYAEAGQSNNNAILKIDLKRGSIEKRTTGGTPLSLAIDPVTGFVYMGDGAGFVSLLDDWNGASSGGANTNFDFQDGYRDFQRGSNKSFWALEFFINTNGQSLTPTVYYDGGQSSEALASISTTSLSRVVRPLESTASRKAQNLSVRLNGALSTVNMTGTPQIQLVHIKPYFDLRTGRARTGQ